MAQDLQAFLEDRPIKARRLTAVGRSWRWCRRNPAVAVLSANMVAALVLAGVVGWVSYAKTKDALEKEAKQLAEAKQARADAEKARADAVQASEKLAENLRMSLEAFEAVFEAAGGPPQGFGGRGFGPGGFGGGFGGFPIPPPHPPGGAPPARPGEDEKAAVLEAVLAFYDKFAERNATASNPRLQLDAARAHRRVGEVHAWRGSAEKAVTAFRRAAGLLEDLARKNPGDETVRTELVLTYLNAPPDAFAGYEMLLARAMDLARTLDGSPRKYLRGSAALKLGTVRDRAKNQAGAEEAYRDAVAALADRGDDRPPHVVPELAQARIALAALLTRSDRATEARRLLEESLAELRPMGDRPPGPGRGRPPWEFRDLIAKTNQELARAYDKLGDRPAADRARAEAERVGGGFGGPGGPKGKDGGRPK
jgi:hypothetical protein